MAKKPKEELLPLAPLVTPAQEGERCRHQDPLLQQLMPERRSTLGSWLDRIREMN